MPVGLAAVEGIGPDGVVRDDEAFAASVAALELSPEHAAALQDGEVDFQEYEGLVQDTMECLRAAGLTVQERGQDTDEFTGVTSVTYGFSADGSDLEEGQALRRDAVCSSVHHWLAYQIYDIQNAVGLEEQQDRLEAAFSDYRDCLDDSGLDVPSMEELNGNYVELLKFADEGHGCPPP